MRKPRVVIFNNDVVFGSILGKWKAVVRSMKPGQYVAVPFAHKQAIQVAAWRMKKRIETHKMLLVKMN